MLDTIRVKFPISPSPEQLEIWTTKTTKSRTGIKESSIYNPTIGNTMCKFTYYPYSYNGDPLLTLELSLPKLVLGNNYQMLGSIDGTIKVANHLINHSSLPIPKIDLSQGVLIRLDMCYNHQVGDMVDDYIKALGYLDFPHRRTSNYRHEGVQYKSKHITTKFYDKEKETGYSEAFGILRQETTMHKGKNIQSFTGKKKPTLLDINYDLVNTYLRRDLDNLGLLNNSIGTTNSTLNKLSSDYGSDASFYYFGLLKSKMDKSRKELVSITDTHPRSLDRKLRKIREAGIPLTLTDREEPLPPLTINYE